MNQRSLEYNPNNYQIGLKSPYSHYSHQNSLGGGNQFTNQKGLGAGALSGLGGAAQGVGGQSEFEYDLTGMQWFNNNQNSGGGPPGMPKQGGGASSSTATGNYL